MELIIFLLHTSNPLAFFYFLFFLSMMNKHTYILFYIFSDVMPIVRLIFLLYKMWKWEMCISITFNSIVQFDYLPIYIDPMQWIIVYREHFV